MPSSTHRVWKGEESVARRGGCGEGRRAWRGEESVTMRRECGKAEESAARVGERGEGGECGRRVWLGEEIATRGGE